MPDRSVNVNPVAGDKPGLFASSGVVASATMLSRMSGLIRDIIIATLFGSTPAADAFFVAFKIPNYFRRLFAEGAFIQGFVPVLTEYRENRSSIEVHRLIARVTGTLGLFLGLLTLGMVLFSPWVVRVIAPGFVDDPERFGLVKDMLRLTFFYLPLVAFTALNSGALNVHGRFAVPALAPIWLNLCLIGAALWLAPVLDTPIMALAWGVVAAGIAQWLFLVPSLYRQKLLVIPRPGFRDPGIRRIVRLMMPALFAASASQLNLLIDMLLASFLITGSISWLYYSDRLVELPIGVIGVAIGVVILPSLSSDHVTKNREAFIRTLDWAIRLVLVIGAPATLALILVSEPLLATLFLYGVNTSEDIRMAALSLDAYAVGLLGFMGIKVLAPGYFARQDTRTPTRIAICAMLLNVALNLLLIQWLAHAGLALATAIAALVNAGALGYGLWRTGLYRMTRALYLLVLRLVLALLSMSLVFWFSVPTLEDWASLTIFSRVSWLFGLCFMGAAAYFATLWICGVRIAHFIRP